MNKDLSIVLAVFAYGGVSRQTHAAVIRELYEGAAIGTADPGDDALISRARSRVATRFLYDSQADVLMMVDRDIEWAPGDLSEMCTKAHEHGAIIGGLYSNRDKKGGPTSRLTKLHDREVPAIGTDALYPAESLATGFLAISRKALTQMRERLMPGRESSLHVRMCTDDDGGPLIDFFRPDSFYVGETLRYVGEDFSFCARAKAASVPLYAWMKPKLIHHGEVGFTL